MAGSSRLVARYRKEKEGERWQSRVKYSSIWNLGVIRENELGKENESSEAVRRRFHNLMLTS